MGEESLVMGEMDMYFGAGGSSPEAAMARLVEETRESSDDTGLERRGSLTELDRNTFVGHGVSGIKNGVLTPKPGKSYAMAAVGAKTPEAEAVEDAAGAKAAAGSTGSKLNPALGSRIQEYKRTLSEDVSFEAPADGTPGTDGALWVSGAASPWANVRHRMISGGAGQSGSAQKWESVLAAVRAVDSPRSSAGSTRFGGSEGSPAGSDGTSGYDSPATMTLSGAPSLAPANALQAAASAAAAESPPSVLSAGSTQVDSPDAEEKGLQMTEEKATPPLMLTPMYVEAAEDVFATMLDDAFAIKDEPSMLLSLQSEPEAAEMPVSVVQQEEVAEMPVSVVQQEEVAEIPVAQEVQDDVEVIPAVVIADKAASPTQDSTMAGWSQYAQERAAALVEAVQPKVGWRWRASRRAAMAAGNLAKAWMGMRREDRRKLVQIGGAGLLLASAGFLFGSVGQSTPANVGSQTALAVIVPLQYGQPVEVTPASPSFTEAALDRASSVVSDLASLRPNELVHDLVQVASESFTESVAYARHEMSSLMQDPVGFASSLEVRANVQLDYARDATKALSEDISQGLQRLRAVSNFYTSLAVEDVSKLHQLAVLHSVSAWNSLASVNIPSEERSAAMAALGISAVASILLSHVIVKSVLVQVLKSSSGAGAALQREVEVDDNVHEDVAKEIEEEISAPMTPVQATPPPVAAPMTTGLRRTTRRPPPRTPRFA